MKANPFAIAALTLAAFAACADVPESQEEAASIESPLGGTISGSLSSSGQSWITHSLDVPAAGDLTLVLDWTNASADFNLFLIDPDGVTVAHQNGSAKPETLTFHVDEPGAYKVGVKAKTGSSAYTLTTSFVPDVVEYDFSGNAASGSWITHTFAASSGDNIDATLSWATASTNLNVFLYDPSGTLLDGASSTTDRPEAVSAVAATSGTYKIGIKAKTGSSAYNLHIEVGGGSPPTPVEPSYPGRPVNGKLA
ncbi:MAG: hypothetical protein HOV80_14420 [Polyangiaceae bacterium]|nr:hypothetical protein [Polyangiaceae bacterium]